MKTAVVAFGGAVVVGVVATRLVRTLALRYGAVDYALVSRKIHRRPVPRLGGIGIVFAFLSALGGLMLLDGNVARELVGHGRQALGLLVGSLAIVALGIYDDLRGANAATKFAIQAAIAVLMYVSGFRIDAIATPFAAPIPLGVLAAPFTMFWIVGVINAINLIDGLDGLAGGVALAAALTLLAIAGVRGEVVIVVAAAALAGALVGFLAYNFHPASIFMGDTGSMFLGLVLATLGIHANEHESSAVSLAVPVVALGLPIADTLLAMARRAARGLPMFRGDRGHIHHRLLDRGFSHRQTVLILYGTSIALGLAALALAFSSRSASMWFLLAVTAVAYLLLRMLGFLDLGNAPELMAQRRRNMLLRAVIRRASEELKDAGTPEDVWKQVRSVGRFLGASCYGLGLASAADGPVAFSEGFEEAPIDLMRVRYGLMPERPGANYIELAFSDGRSAIDRDTEIAVEMLCHHLLPVVERLENGTGDQRRGLRVFG